MLSPNDFKEKQILIVENPPDIAAKIKFANDNIVYCKDEETCNQISCHKVLAIFVIGDASLTTGFIRHAVKYGISVFLLNRNLGAYAEIGAKAEGNYLLRARQYAATNELDMAKNLMKNKLLNQIALLKTFACLNGIKEDYEQSEKEIVRKINGAKNEKELLGLEGSRTKTFFRTYFAELGWYKRLPRAKVDPYNLLMDIGYTFLLNYVDSLLRLYGFDVYRGFYHKLFFKRKSLSCDIVEPFRCIIDKQLLKSFHLKQIDEKDFRFADGHYSLDYTRSQKYARIFLNAIIRHKEDIYSYVYGFYRFIMDDTKNEFPYFEMK